MDAKTLSSLADKEIVKDNYCKAFSLYMQATKLDEYDLYPKFRIAQILSSTEKYDEAIQILDMIGDVTNIEFYNEYAYVLYNVGRHGEAIKAYKKALKLDKNDMDALQGLINIYTSKNDVSRSLKYLDKACAINKDGFLLSSRGRIYSKLGRSMEAIDDFQQASKLIDDINIFYDLGYEFYIIKEYEESINMFDVYLKQKPDHVNALIYKSSCLNGLQEYEKSLKVLDEAFLINKERKIILAKACTLMRLDRNEDAHEYVNMVLENKPDDILALSIKGNILNAEKKPEEALKYLDKALSTHPKLSSTLANKGVSMLLLGNADEALKLLDDAIKLSPTDVDTIIAKAAIHEMLGDKREEQAAYIEILKIEPHNQQALDKLDAMRSF